MNILLQASTTKAATASGTALTFGGAGLRQLGRMTSLLFTLDIVSAERDTGDELYDIYVTTSDGVSSWDIVHFPQIATTGAKRFTARVNLDALVPQSVTTAAPGVASTDSATLATISGGTNAIKSLAAGAVRHGPIGEVLNHEIVIAGTIATGIVYTLKVEGR